MSKLVETRREIRRLLVGDHSIEISKNAMGKSRVSVQIKGLGLSKPYAFFTVNEKTLASLHDLKELIDVLDELIDKEFGGSVQDLVNTATD